MDLIEVSIALLLLMGCSLANGSPKVPFNETRKIPERFSFAANDIYAKSNLPKGLKNMTFSGRELTADETSLDEKCSKGQPMSVAWQYYGPYAKPNITDDGNITVEGIFPHLLNKMLHVCCNSKTTVKFGKVLGSIRDLESQPDQPSKAYDFSFPITGKRLADESFKGLPYIPFVQAPRVALLVRDEMEDTKTSQLMKTVFKAWPILVFILVAATLSGIIIWLLDRLKNPDEFPRPFIVGAWEGFWWAFVTMTTVGYGDRAPKSFLARIFCIVWILVGIIIIAIFTAIVTASLSASIQHHFTVHGSLIGAMNGSEELRLGVSLNAEVIAYHSIPEMNEDLMNRSSHLKGSLIDNYVLTYYSDFVETNDVRIETTFEHAITYGLSLRANESSDMVRCFRRYVRNHPQEAFEIIAMYLKPLKNPTDEVSQEVKASEGLFFYREKAFEHILYYLAGAVGFLLLVGVGLELLVNRPRRRNLQKQDDKIGAHIALTSDQSRCDCHEMLLSHQTIQSIKFKSEKIKELIREYEEFYDGWLQRVRAIEHNENGATPEMV